MTLSYKYRVARLPFEITYEEECEDAQQKNGEHLTPSLQPFKIESADGPLCFRLTVNDSFKPKPKGQEIGQFDCGGNNHGVYLLPDGGYQIIVSDCYGHKCSFLQTDKDFTKGMVKLNGDRNMRTYGLNNSIMMMYAFSNAQNGTLLMHASVIRKAGIGYLFLGVSGTGKSTHTQHWLDWLEGCDLMNDDNPVVRFVDGEAIVFGSPWSGKTPCYRNIEAPIGGFVQLKQAPYNKIRQMEVIETFASLLPSCSVMKWDKRVYTGICDTIGNIMESTNTYLLENLPDREAVELSYRTLTGNK